MADFQTFTLGRGRDADIRYPDDPGVSRRHLELTLTGDGRLYLIDAASTNGTFAWRDGAWRRLAQDFVAAHETLRVGKQEVPVAALLKRLQSLRRAVSTGEAARQ